MNTIHKQMNYVNSIMLITYICSYSRRIYYIHMLGIMCSTDKMLHRTTIHTMHDKGTSVITIVPR